MNAPPGFFYYLMRPGNPNRIATLRQRWLDFPQSWRTSDQAIGRYVVGCGATHGVYERCNFGCTACYLGARANRQQALPFEEVKRQLEALRRYLGPGGNVQITSGEVTLLPVEDLVRILRTARDLDLSPMVMTHGDEVLHDPLYLDRLVLEGGLTKISIHVDSTQRGRRGFTRVDSEAALNPVRDRMATMLRDAMRRTGRRLKAATTLTANRENLAELGAVVDWMLANLDAFRILSIQPEAHIGRTGTDRGVCAEAVWRELEKVFGFPLNPHPFHFGHTACTRFALLLAIQTHREPIYLQAVRPANVLDQALMRAVLRDFGGLVVNDRPAREIAAKLTGVVMRKPGWLVRIAIYGLRRSWQERGHFPRILGAALRLRLRIRPFALVIHSFMSAAELATPLGRERLAACVFKLAVGDRMVSMCEMNATGLREQTYSV